MARTAPHGGDAVILVDLAPAAFDGSEALAERMCARAEAVGGLVARARRAGAPVVWVNDNHGRWDASLHTLVREAREGPFGPLLRRVAPEDGEPALLKPRHSGFFETPLAFLLDELGVTRVVIAGMQANICVLFTAMDAHVRGLEIVVPRDGVASLSEEDERTALHVLRRLLGEDATPLCADVELRSAPRT